jgi:alpha-1,2-mannosyltransferase
LPLAACFVLLLSPIQNNLLNGQVNFVVLLLCVLFATELAAGRTLRAALFLALGMAIKLTPAVFLLYLVLRRRFAAAALTLAVFAVLCLLPVVTIGPEMLGYQWNHAKDLSSMALHPPTFPGDYPPFSLPGVAGHLVPALRGGVLFPAACVVLVLAVVGWIDRKAAARKTGGRDVAIAQLYLLTMLLISPLSEKHHLAFLIPGAVIATLGWIALERKITRPQGAFVVTFWVAILAARWTSLPLHFLAIVALFAALTHALLSVSSAPEGPFRASDRA